MKPLDTTTIEKGFYIPYRYAEDVRTHARGRYYTEVARLFDDQKVVFAEFLNIIDGFGNDLRSIGGAPPPAPRWAQDWFPRIDAAALYSIVRHYRPTTIIEIGAGHSTRFVVQATLDGGFKANHIAFDPKPRAAIAKLPVTLIRETLQNGNHSSFSKLTDGDVLIIDSSHVLMPGSDVDLILNTILPALPAGVFIHFHDIFLPGPYPEKWAWRGYSEQLGVATLLLGGGYRPLFASNFMLRAMERKVYQTVISDLPLLEGAFESSLWVQKES